MSIPALEWQDHAACTPADAHLFTADKKPSDDEIFRAAIICAPCPVQRQCAARALTTGASGIFAAIYVPVNGTTRTRARLRLERKAYA